MTAPDWYERRDELQPGQVFRTQDGSIVQMDRRVAGDGSKWFVLSFHNGSWFADDGTIEPGELSHLLSDAEVSALGKG